MQIIAINNINALKEESSFTMIVLLLQIWQSELLMNYIREWNESFV